MAGRDSRMQAQEHRQNLSLAEEKTLVRWIANLNLTNSLVGTSSVRLLTDVTTSAGPKVCGQRELPKLAI